MWKRLTERFTRKNKKTQKTLPNLKRIGTVYKTLNNTGIEMTRIEHAGLFVDNDPLKIQEVKKCKNGGVMDTIEVRETPAYRPIEFTFKTGEERIAAEQGFRDSIENYKREKNLTEAGKDAADVFTRITLQNPQVRKIRTSWREIDTTYIYSENIDEASGITKENVDEIKKWVQNNKNKHLFVLFDYDRTLTKIEGGYFFGKSMQEMKTALQGYQTDKLTAEGFMEYYVGGPDRLKMLQEMFDVLYDPQYNVDVYIVTNNPSCLITRNRGLFDEVLKVLTRGRPLRYLCGVEYERDKYKTILSDADLTKKVCPRVTRGGKRKTRKPQRKQKH